MKNEECSLIILIHSSFILLRSRTGAALLAASGMGEFACLDSAASMLRYLNFQKERASNTGKTK